MHFCNTQIRGWKAGVIKIAYTVNLQENMAAGEGRAAMVSQACEREAVDTVNHKPRHNLHTQHAVGVLSLQYKN